MNNIDKVIGLLNHSYSAFHAVKNIEDELIKAGFLKLDEKESFDLKKNGKYYLKRNDSSILAFKVPEAFDRPSFKITATHTDSPTLKIKPNPILRYKNLTSLNVEPYGGMIMSSWLDRPLSLAGRVMVKDKKLISSRLLNIDEDLLVIPNLCIHMNRTINSGYAYNPSKDLIPLFGITDKKFDFSQYLKEKLGLKGKEEILSFDLFLYNRDLARRVGYKKEFLSSSRLDDLSSSYSTLLGFLESQKPTSTIDVYVSFDNEEVGSLTKQGANSTFLKNNLRRIAFALGIRDDSYEKALASSILVSADNAHANHPNHPEISDSTTDIELNKGVVIKYNANQSYTSDSFSSSILKSLAKKAKVPYQEFTNRSDLRGGSTLGNISNSEVSLTSVDIGLAQLAMHSCNELMGVNDIDYLVKLIKEYYDTELVFKDNQVSIN